MLKWKIAKVPFGLNHPVWVQDTDFSLSYHVRRIACPRPGDKKTFNELVSDLYAQPLDKSRPLWLMWIVESLEDNKVALVCMFHHAYADGAGAGAGIIFEHLLSPNSQYRAQSSEELGVNSQKPPNPATLLLKGLVDLPWMFAKILPPLLIAGFKQSRIIKAYKKQGKPLPPQPQNAPDSPLNTTYSHGRTFAYHSFNVHEMKAVARHFKVTLNDLFVAMVSSAIRRYYLRNKVDPTEPLVSVIPINIRNEQEQKEVLGNLVSNSFMSVPIHLDDPVQRLEYAAQSGTTMKTHMQAIGGKGFLQAIELIPPIAIALMNWALMRKKGQLKLIGNLGISNVRGPAEPMYLGKAKVLHWLSIGHVFAGLGINITGWSYHDQFNVCIMAEEKVIPDGEQFMGDLAAAYNEYKSLYEQTDTPSTKPAKDEQ